MKRASILIVILAVAAGSYLRGASMQAPELVTRHNTNIMAGYPGVNSLEVIHMQNDVGRCGTFALEPNEQAKQLLDAYPDMISLTITGYHVDSDGNNEGTGTVGPKEVHKEVRMRFGSELSDNHWDRDVYCEILADRPIANQAPFKAIGATLPGFEREVQVGPNTKKIRYVRPIDCGRLFRLFDGTSGRFCSGVEEQYDPEFNLRTY